MTRKYRRACPSGKETHGQSKTLLYGLWANMWQRCTNPAAKNYQNYGGRGVTVCPTWATFVQFAADMGPRPPGHTLDRRDNDGPYAPTNCRWATVTEQNRNSRNARLEDHEPAQIVWLVRQCGFIQKDVAAFFGVSASLVSRIISGQRRVPL